MRVAVLVGGTNDGKTVSVEKRQGRYPPFYYTPKLITMAEVEELKIDDFTSWRLPDEVYKWLDGAYRYAYTVNYKPET
jgi:hypothetical protein